MSIVSRNRPPFGEDGEAIIFVGEVATVGFRLTDANGAVQSYAGRTFGLQVYLDGGTNTINVNGALTSHADGDYIQCALTEDETALLTAGTLYGWGFTEYTADGPIVVCGGVVRAAAGATAAQASGSPGAGIGGITLYSLRIDTGIVTVSYMGAPGAGVLPGGTDGQFLVKDGASDYSTEWVTLGITHVAGLSTSLSTLTSADVSLTSRISTEEATRATADTSLTSRVSTEEVARADGDTSLTSRLSTEETTRAAADTSLTTRLSTEETARASADTSLATADTSLTTRLSAEEVARASVGTSLTTRVGAEEAARGAADTSLQTRFSTADVSLAAADTSLTTRLSTEEATRGAADTSLTTRLSTEETARAAGDNSLTTRLSAEEVNRASADTSLVTRLSTEETTRSSAVSTVTVATTSLTTRVSSEEATRGTADTSLQTRFSTTDVSLTTRLSTEETTRGTADTSLTSRLSTEETARGSADTSIVTRFSTADTSLAAAAAATYLPLSGGVMTGVLAFLAGTAALPGLAVAGDLNTGIYGVSEDVLGVSTGGSQVQSWGVGTSTLTGTFGIGTAAPSTSLHVFGTGATIQSATATNTLSTLTSIQLSRPQLTVVSRAANNWAGGIHVYAGGQTSGTFLSSDIAGVGRWSAGAVWSGSGNYNATETTGSALRQDGGALVYSAATGLTVGATTTLTELFRIALTGVATFYGNVLASADATYDLGLSGSGRFRDAHLSRALYVGTLGSTSGAAVNAYGTNWAILGGDVSTDATAKTARFGGAHYTNAALPVLALNVVSGLTANTVNVGGGNSSGNAATLIKFFTGATTTTATGTSRWEIDGSGRLYPSADDTYDLGSTAVRVRSGYFGTNVVIGYSTTSSAQLHVGAGGNSSVRDLSGATVTAQVVNSQTSGFAAIAANVIDGTNNRRAALINDHTNSLWGLSLNYSSGAIDFAIINGSTTTLRISAAGIATFYNNLLPSTDAAYDLGSAALEFRDLHLSRYLRIGGSAPAGASVSAAIQSFGSEWTLVASNVLTDATLKRVRLGVAHYDNAEEPVLALYSFSSASANGVYIGGGTGSGNAATTVGIYTAADTTTTSGTQRWLWDSSGHFGPAASLTYDIGPNRVRTIFARNIDLSYAADGPNIINVANGSTGASARAGLTLVNDGGSSAFVALHGSGTAPGIGRANAMVVQGPYSAGVVLNASHASGVIDFVTGGTSSGNTRWQINSSGHFLANADNTYDIGASGANRPRDLHLARNLNGAGYLQAGAGSYIYWSGRSLMASPSNGVITLTNNGATDFSRLQYGGTTPAFPSEKRSGTIIQARLADDSDWASYQGKLTTHANAVAETPTATHTLTLYDAAGTAYKVLAVAA